MEQAGLEKREQSQLSTIKIPFTPWCFSNISKVRNFTAL